VCLEGHVRLLLGGLKDFLSSRALCYKKPKKFKTGFIPSNSNKLTEYRGKSMKQEHPGPGNLQRKLSSNSEIKLNGSTSRATKDNWFHSHSHKSSFKRSWYDIW